MLQPRLKKDIMKHLESLGNGSYKSDSETIVKTISERFDIPHEVAEKILADWSAGKEQ